MHAARLAIAIGQLMGAETLLEQYANVEVFNTCMDYLSEQSRWPTIEEIAAITGLCVGHVLEVEERLGGTYEFALRAGLVKESD